MRSNRFIQYKNRKKYKSSINKIDIKYINIPNICFSLTSENDKRELEYSIQRKTVGFDDSETWSLYTTISRYILPRLERFNEVNCVYPCFVNDETEWYEMIDKMIFSFKILASDIDIDDDYDKVLEGLDLFSKHFLSLWW